MQLSVELLCRQRLGSSLGNGKPLNKVPHGSGRIAVKLLGGAPTCIIISDLSPTMLSTDFQILSLAQGSMIKATSQSVQVHQLMTLTMLKAKHRGPTVISLPPDSMVLLKHLDPALETIAGNPSTHNAPDHIGQTPATGARHQNVGQPTAAHPNTIRHYPLQATQFWVTYVGPDRAICLEGQPGRHQHPLAQRCGGKRPSCLQLINQLTPELATGCQTRTDAPSQPTSIKLVGNTFTRAFNQQISRQQNIPGPSRTLIALQTSNADVLSHNTISLYIQTWQLSRCTFPQEPRRHNTIEGHPTPLNHNLKINNTGEAPGLNKFIFH
jgi:hypothetical protein